MVGLSLVAGAVAGRLAVAHALADIAADVATALAVLAAGGWAYFQYVRFRHAKPHLQVNVTGRWVWLEEKCFLVLSVKLENTGKTRVPLVRSGTAVTVSRMATWQPRDVEPAAFRPVYVGDLLVRDDWFEPSEKATEDIMIAWPFERHIARVGIRLVIQCRPRTLETETIVVIGVDECRPRGKEVPSAGTTWSDGSNRGAKESLGDV